MKWITLKTYLINLIEQEVETVYDKYFNFLNEIRRTNSQKTISELNEFREEVPLYFY
jgi:hypothetical protein